MNGRKFFFHFLTIMVLVAQLELPDLSATWEFGRRLGKSLFAGAVVALIGPLGAGKTQVVRALAEGLGITDSRVVNSPTFVLIQEYDARLPIYHFDAYRLTGPREFFDLGVHEYFNGQGVCMVEWADKMEPCLPTDHLRITLTITGPTSRLVVLEGRGEKYCQIVKACVSLLSLCTPKEKDFFLPLA